jgi:hypothetical protein
MGLGSAGVGGGTYLILRYPRGSTFFRAGCCLTVVSGAAILAEITQIWSMAQGIINPINHHQDYDECVVASGGDLRCLRMH